MNQLRHTIHPGLRGALFYATYWGVDGLFEPFITVHFLQLGFSGQQIGWLAAVFPLFNFLLIPPLSRYADRTNRRILLLALACIGEGAALVLLPIPVGFWAVLAAYALVMIFRSPIVPLADSLIAKMAERRRLDFGQMRLWGSLCFTITAVSLGAVWQQTGFRTMFTVGGIGFALVILAALLQEEAQEKRTKEDNRPAGEPVGAVARVPTAATRKSLPEAGILFLFGANFLIIGALFMAGTFSTVYLKAIGGTEMQVGALFGISALAEVPGMLFGRRIARKLGDSPSLLLAYVVIAMGFAGFGIARTPEMLLAFGLLRGLGFGLMLVCTVTILNHRAPENMYATYQGLNNALCWGLAPLLGGPISGAIYQSLGASTLFFLNGIMALLAVVLIVPTFRLWKKQVETAALV